MCENEAGIFRGDKILIRTALSTKAATGNLDKPRLHLRKEEPIVAKGQVILSAILESNDQEPSRIWFVLPEELAQFTTTSLDAFVVASIFTAMEGRYDLHVHGEASPSLLRNLMEFQAAWHHWVPERYSVVNIAADREVEQEQSDRWQSAIAAFSCGVDSTYTIWRHRNENLGRAKRNIEAALFIQGFDIPIAQQEEFARAAVVAKKTLDSLGIKLLTMKSGLMNPQWENTHGAALASCLMLLQGRYREGLIASTYAYNEQEHPWGSNVVTDWLLSSKSFTVVHDGSAVSRAMKLKAIAEWPEGYNNLRVCFSAKERDKNCGLCPKCVMMLLSFRALKLPIPKSFEYDIKDEDILALTHVDKHFADAFEKMVGQFRSMGYDKESWLLALEHSAQVSKRRLASSAFSRAITNS